MIAVTEDAINWLRARLVEETGTSRAEALDWVKPQFAALADDVYASLDSPTLTLENAWDVFRRMAHIMADIDIDFEA